MNQIGRFEDNSLESSGGVKRVKSCPRFQDFSTFWFLTVFSDLRGKICNLCNLF